MWTILLAVILGGLGIYHYVFRNLNYFKKRGTPYVPPIPLFGNMAGNIFRTKTLSETVCHAYHYKPDARYIGFFDFSSPVVIVKDPELIKLVTIKSFDNFPDHKMLSDEITDAIFKDSLFGLQGQKWRDVRALLSPCFTSSKMRIIFKLVKDYTQDFIGYVKERSSDSKILDMKNITTRFTNDVIATSAFGIGVDSLNNPNNEFYQVGKSATNFVGSRSLRLFIIRTFPNLSKILNVKLWTPAITNFYKNVVKATIANRKANGIVRPDLIQLLMQANEKSEDITMTDDEMAAHAFIFYFGGFDSTAVLANCVLHEIMMNPDVFQTLRSEVDEVLERCNGDVNYEALHAMQYLDAVVDEALRLYSPATVADRLCRERFELPPSEPGSKPFIVEPGVSLWLPIDAIHKDPKYFSNPEQFYPDRFVGENKNDIDPSTFLPFGSGPRFCIGNRFARMVTKLLVFELVANFDLSPCSKTVHPIKWSAASFTTSIDGEIWMNIEPRCRI